MRNIDNDTKYTLAKFIMYFFSNKKLLRLFYKTYINKNPSNEELDFCCYELFYSLCFEKNSSLGNTIKKHMIQIMHNLIMFFPCNKNDEDLKNKKYHNGDYDFVYKSFNKRMSRILIEKIMKNYAENSFYYLFDDNDVVNDSLTVLVDYHKENNNYKTLKLKLKQNNRTGKMELIALDKNDNVRIKKIVKSNGYNIYSYFKNDTLEHTLEKYSNLVDAIKKIDKNIDNCCWCFPIANTRTKCPSCIKLLEQYKEICSDYDKICKKYLKDKINSKKHCVLAKELKTIISRTKQKHPNMAKIENAKKYNTKLRVINKVNIEIGEEIKLRLRNVKVYLATNNLSSYKDVEMFNTKVDGVINLVEEIFETNYDSLLRREKNN